MTAAVLPVWLCSVLLHVLQVSLHPGVTWIGTDFAPFLCDEHEGWQGAAGAGDVVTQDELLWELVGCVREAAGWVVRSNWKRQGETA